MSDKKAKADRKIASSKTERERAVERMAANIDAARTQVIEVAEALRMVLGANSPAAERLKLVVYGVLAQVEADLGNL